MISSVMHLRLQFSIWGVRASDSSAADNLDILSTMVYSLILPSLCFGILHAHLVVAQSEGRVRIGSELWNDGCLRLGAVPGSSGGSPARLPDCVPSISVVPTTSSDGKGWWSAVQISFFSWPGSQHKCEELFSGSTKTASTARRLCVPLELAAQAYRVRFNYRLVCMNQCSWKLFGKIWTTRL